jgi:hypothetical protein
VSERTTPLLRVLANDLPDPVQCAPDIFDVLTRRRLAAKGGPELLGLDHSETASGMGAQGRDEVAGLGRHGRTGSGPCRRMTRSYPPRPRPVRVCPLTKYPEAWADQVGPDLRSANRRSRLLVGRHRLSPYAKLTGLSGTREANPCPFGGRHALMGGSVGPQSGWSPSPSPRGRRPGESSQRWNVRAQRPRRTPAVRVRCQGRSGRR